MIGFRKGKNPRFGPFVESSFDWINIAMVTAFRSDEPSQKFVRVGRCLISPAEVVYDTESLSIICSLLWGPIKSLESRWSKNIVTAEAACWNGQSCLKFRTTVVTIDFLRGTIVDALPAAFQNCVTACCPVLLLLISDLSPYHCYNDSPIPNIGL